MYTNKPLKVKGELIINMYIHVVIYTRGYYRECKKSREKDQHVRVQYTSDARYKARVIYARLHAETNVLVH